MKVLINCPLNFNLNSDKKNTLGGIESLNLNLARALSQNNIDITLSTMCKKITHNKKIKNIPIEYLKNNADKYQYHAIISSNDATIFNYFKHTKKIFWLHNQLQIEKSLRKKQYFSLLLNRPTAVFVSSYLRSITSKLFFFNKRVVIPNFLLSDFVNQKINYKRKKIFVWSVQRTKGLNQTIEIWINNISPFYKNAELHIFGLSKLPNEFDKIKLQSKKIYFKGRVDKQILKKIYNKSLAMICLGYDETFCLNALEANSCGLPILTFGKTALSNFVKNNFNGFICIDYQDLSSNIIKMINLDEQKHNKLINNSILWSKKYSLKTIIKSWLKIL